MVRFVTIGIILLAVLLWPHSTEWIVGQDIYIRMALHHFFHGNIFHLLANLLSLYFVLPYLKRWQMGVGYGIASLSVLASATPVIGFSNLIYAFIGLRSPSFKSKWWRHSGTIAFMVITLAMVFIPNVSAVTHIICFSAGVLVSAIVRQLKQISDDCKRYI
jgi:membrane associated rhomboid family serine protease